MAEASKKHRLVTRSDFDGLVCAVLLEEQGLIDEIKFVHPKDMQDGKVEITDRDITTNLPYVAGVHLSFDHHSSEVTRSGGKAPKNQIIHAEAASAARVVYDHFGGRNGFPRVPLDMMDAVDKADSAKFSREEILHPRGWVLLSFLMDPRTGLGRFRTFKVSNYQLMMDLIDYCRNHTIEQILELADVKERVDLYVEQDLLHKAQIERCTTTHGNLVVLDLLAEDPIYAGNRFVIYARYPEANISIHVMWGLKKQNTVFAVGKSILNRTSKTNIGDLCLKYGGGGHENAGTCQVANEDADRVLKELVAKINADG
jgi:nanoRNase/pAp phosphatase (c-di-AMP/oligoRNAs hydrolase)